MRLLITLAILSLSTPYLSNLQGQGLEDVLFVYGTTTEYHSGERMPLVNVTVMKDGEELHNLWTGIQGRYETVLDLGHEYGFYFEKDGFFKKNFIIDTTGLTEEQQRDGFSFEVDMSLVPKTRGLDIGNTDEPVSIAKYDSDYDMLIFDAEMVSEYTNRVEAAIHAMQKGGK